MTRQEFGHISTEIRGKLVAMARPFCRTSGLSEDPEDLVQEALVTLWELSEEGYPIRDAEALAVRLTKNICVNHYRKRKPVFQAMPDFETEGAPPALTRLDETEKEFDRIVAEGRPAAHRRGRRLGWVLSLAAAAALALFLLFRPHAAPEKPISPVAIAEGIEQILLLNADDIVSVEAVPSGSKAILTAHMKDGGTFSYILTFNEDEGTTSLLACNNPTD